MNLLRSKRINISQGSLSDIEKGKGYPALETVISISQVFDVDLNWLVKGNEVLDKQVLKLPCVSIKSDELDLLTNYRGLSVIDKVEINEFIKLKISMKQSK